MVRELGVPWPFTPFSTSGFWGRGGQLLTEAPVVSRAGCLLLGWVFLGGKRGPLLTEAPAVGGVLLARQVAL